MTDAVITTQESNPEAAIISLIAPGEFSWDNWPTYTEIPGSPLADKITEIQAAHPSYNPGSNPRWMKPKLANNFLRSDNPGIIMTYAEVCFLRAEGAILGWTSEDAKSLYETGVREAMNILSEYYGCEAISDAEFTAYIAQPAIAFGASQEQQKMQINTQAWILHFHNPAEAWANVRRSDYPRLKAPNTKNPLIDGAEIPVRLCYPVKEETYSRDAYEAAKTRVPGGYSWHAPLWWDKYQY